MYVLLSYTNLIAEQNFVLVARPPPGAKKTADSWRMTSASNRGHHHPDPCRALQNSLQATQSQRS
eukprot:67506-Chlamydomonas_euryale.AAC.10